MTVRSMLNFAQHLVEHGATRFDLTVGSLELVNGYPKDNQSVSLSLHEGAWYLSIDVSDSDGNLRLNTKDKDAQVVLQAALTDLPQWLLDKPLAALPVD